MKIPLSLFILLFALNCFAQKVSLSLNLKQDSIYYLTTNANATIAQTLQGSQQVSTVILSGKVAHKVTAIKDTIYQMDVYYQSLSMNMNVLGKTVSYNSNDGDKNIFSKIMNGILNQPIVMLISKRGRVLEIKNTDNLFAHMFDGITAITDEQKAQLKAQMEKSYGEKSIRSNFQEAFPMLPAGSISADDKWNALTTIEAAGNININTIYHLQSTNNNFNVVHGDAIVSMGLIGSQVITSTGVPMRFTKVNGKITSDLKLDKNTGWIVEAKTTRYITCVAEILKGPSFPAGMSIPMTIGSDITLSGN